MKKNLFSKDKLIQYLLVVSIFSITMVGLYALKLLTRNALSNIFNAFASVFTPFVIAFFLSFILGPLSEWLHIKFKIKRGLSIVISIIFGLLFFVLIIVFIVVFLFGQLSSIASSLISLIDNETVRSLITQIEALIGDYIDENGVSQIISQITSNGENLDKIINISVSIFQFFINVFQGFIKLFLTMLLTPVFLFYLISEKEQIFTAISSVFPTKIKPHLVELGIRSNTVIRNYFTGQGIMMLLVFSYFFIGLSIVSFFVPNFGISHALLFAILLGLTNIVPYLGAWIGLSIPIVYLFTKYLEFEQGGNEGMIFLIGIAGVFVVQFTEQILEANIVSPQIMGKHVRIHPLVVLSSLIFFGGVFGFVGVLLAVPIAGTIKVVYQYLRALFEDEPKKIKSK